MRDKLLDYCGTDNPLQLKLRGGGVRRYHAEGRWIDQNVAEHTWRALVILLHLWPASDAQTILNLITHDISEGYTGDIPAPVKRDPDTRSAVTFLESEFEVHLGLDRIDGPPDEVLHLKLADYIEGALTCQELLGVHWRAASIRDKFIEYIGKLLENASPRDRQLVNTLLVEQSLVTLQQIPLKPTRRTEHPAPFGYQKEVDPDDEIPL